jgi:hypothetical protein
MDTKLKLTLFSAALLSFSTTSTQCVLTLEEGLEKISQETRLSEDERRMISFEYQIKYISNYLKDSEDRDKADTVETLEKIKDSLAGIKTCLMFFKVENELKFDVEVNRLFEQFRPHIISSVTDKTIINDTRETLVESNNYHLKTISKVDKSIETLLEKIENEINNPSQDQ